MRTFLIFGHESLCVRLEIWWNDARKHPWFRSWMGQVDWVAIERAQLSPQSSSLRFSRCLPPLYLPVIAIDRLARDGDYKLVPLSILVARFVA